MMRRISVLFALLLWGCGDDSVRPPFDAPPLAPGVKVSGQIVRAPGRPVPIADVTVSVIDPIDDPDHLISAQTDDHGFFVLGDVHPTSGGRVRLFIDGTTGGGGPYVMMNSEFPVDPTHDAVLDVIHLVPMDPTGIVRITNDNAVITHMVDGRDYALLRNDVTISAGTVPSDESPSETRSAQLTIPQGTLLAFPYASPLLVNLTRVDLSAITPPLPRASDGLRYTQYFVTLQPPGLELRNMATGIGQPVGLQLPEVDPWPPPGPVGQSVEFWEAGITSETFQKVATGTVQHIPGVGTMAVSDLSFVTRFGWYAATPPCPSGVTQVHGRTLDAMMQPVVGAQLRTQGLRATSGNDGTFTIANVPLGCLSGGTAPQIEVLGTLARNDGTFLSGTSGALASVPDGTTEVGDITLTTPLYVVRAQPNSAFDVPLDTVFDVFFSEDIDPATLNPAGLPFSSVQVQQISISNLKGSCVTSRVPVPGAALLDAADPKHVQVVPSVPLAAGQTFAGFVDSAALKAASGHTLPSDFSAPFTTIDTAGPDATLVQPAPDIVLISGATLNFTGTASDSVGVARAKFQIFQSDSAGTVGAQFMNDFPAAIISVDPCALNRTVNLHASVQVPVAAGFYLARLVVADTSGNQTQTDHLIQIQPAGNAFPFCGQPTTTAFISSNGYITFDSGDTQFSPSVPEFFMHSRVSAFYTDLDFRPVGQNGTVFWNVDTTTDPSDPAFVVTWFKAGMYPTTPSYGTTHDPACGGVNQPACPNCGAPGQPYCCGQPNDATQLCHPSANTFQIALFKSGAIQLAYDDISDVRATTSGSQTEDMFMGVSCPGTLLSPTPTPTNLLTVQAQPEAGNEGLDVAWAGEPIYDFLSRINPDAPPPPAPGSTLASGLFQTRYFNLLPPGVTTKPFVPIFQAGQVVSTILDDDQAEAVPITFVGPPPSDAGVPDAGAIDARIGLDADTSSCGMAFVDLFAGIGGAGWVDGIGTIQAQFNFPTGVVSDGTTQTLYVADRNNNRIRAIDGQGNVTTLAGNGTGGFFDGTAGPTGTAMFLGPRSVAFGAGLLFVADEGNNRVRQVILGQRTVTTLAGNGQTTPFQDGTLGPGGTTTFFSPGGIAFDPLTRGTLVADANDHRIRRILTSTTTAAGNGIAGFVDNTMAGLAEFNQPYGVTIDPQSGDIYIADTTNHRIRRISGGIVTTLAGNGAPTAVDGTGGANGTASFGNPLSVALGTFQGAPVLYVADATGQAIRMISLPTGNTTTIAGGLGLAGYADGVPGCQARFLNPQGVAFDPGPAAAPLPVVLVADSGNHRIRRIHVP